MKWLAPACAFVVAVAFWPWMMGSATSPRWAAMAPSLFFLDPLAWPFTLWSLWRVDFDQAVHWALLAAVWCWGWRSSETDLRRVTIAFSIGIGLSGVIAVFQHYWGWTGVPQNAEPGGLFLNKNFMGEAACFAFAAVIGLRIWWLVPVTLLPLVMSSSRTACGAALISLIFILPWRKLWPIGVLVCAWALWSQPWSGWHLFDDGPLAQRVALWQDALRHLSWLGNGSYDYSTVQNREPNLHNDWLQFVYENGIVGAGVVVFILWCAVRGLPSFAVALCVVASFGFPLHDPATGWFAAFVLGAGVGNELDRRRTDVGAGAEDAGLVAAAPRAAVIPLPALHSRSPRSRRLVS